MKTIVRWYHVLGVLMMGCVSSSVAADKTDYRFGIGWMRLPSSPARSAAVEIEQEFYRYTYAIDARDWDTLAGVFTPDGVFSMNGGGPKESKMPLKDWFANAFSWSDKTPAAAMLYCRHNICPRHYEIKGDTANVFSDGIEEIVLVEGRRVVLWPYSYHDVWVRTAAGWRISMRKVSMGTKEFYNAVDRLHEPEKIWTHPETWERRGDRIPPDNRDHADIVASVLAAYQAEKKDTSSSTAETWEVLSCPRVDVKTPDTVQVVVFWNVMSEKGAEPAYQNGRYIDQWTRASGEWKRVSRSKIAELEYSLPASAGAPWWAKKAMKPKV